MKRFMLRVEMPMTKRGWESFQARLVALLKRQRPSTMASRVFLSVEWRHGLTGDKVARPEKAWGIIRDAFVLAGVGKSSTEFAIGQCVFYKATTEKPAVLITLSDEP